jgi:AhpD family alkylhydroperoxidase
LVNKHNLTMTQRINVNEIGREAMSALYGMVKYLAKSSLEKSLLHLIEYRVSQINGCAYCLDMHSKDFLALGEDPQKLFIMDAWREAPFYSDRERAALAWAEALTKLETYVLPDAVYEEARKQFTEQELIDLTFGIIITNSYNRIKIAFGADVGSYRTGQFEVK